MIIEFTETAKKEFLSLDKSQQIQFKKALDKLKDYSSQKHLNYGIPAFVIKVNIRKYHSRASLLCKT